MTAPSSSASALDLLFDRIAPGRATSPSETLQRRLIAGGAVLGCLVAAPSAALSAAQHQTGSAIAISAFGAGCLALLFAARGGTGLRALRVTAIVLVSSFLVVASLQTVELQWQQLKWLALLPMLSLFLDEPAQERSGFKGRVRALWSGVALAVALAIMIVVANRSGWTFDTQADSDGWTSLVASGVDVALFLISLAGLLTIHDIALRRAEAELDLLRSMLSVCAWCRRIHDDDEGWIAMERYMTRHKGASLTHGICPECEAKTLAEMEAGH